MTKWLSVFLNSFVSLFRSRRDLALENLLLRQQLAVLKEKSARPRLSAADRSFWMLVSKLCRGWRGALYIVKPETVIRWHREGFRRYWARKCRRKGRPVLDPAIRALIRRISRVNPLWGAPRIHGELLKLGIEISQTTVAKYMTRNRKPPSQSWRVFLENHFSDIIATDFFTVPTATFRVLFVLVVLSHNRREILHTNVTESPTAEWTARQVIEAIGLDEAAKYLVRDQDGKFGEKFSRQVASAGLTEVLTAPASPWQNAYAERVIGTIRRECLDHMIILGEQHLRRTVKRYAAYYNGVRTHLSLEKDSPQGRLVQLPGEGAIRSRPHFGGLHHEYLRQAA
ncbi:integrase core domain-containing protein [Lentisalinibacter orientalis]|uniref:integrase core domain-containing protein n=1 Tax=Lentisalinibacter orientalis TaxID=2992241 RepID=UPI00386E32A1